MPAFAFDQYLKLPWVATGLGHGSRAHAPNEYASIEGMKRFIAGEASLVYAAAAVPRGDARKGLPSTAERRENHVENRRRKRTPSVCRKSTHSQGQIFSATPINSVIQDGPIEWPQSLLPR